MLSDSQTAAIEHVTQYAKLRKDKALETIKEILQMSDITQELFDSAVEKIKKNARVALHFHPDRLTPKLESVAQDLLTNGLYKSQFETFLSNGKVAPHSGGPRDQWEKLLFGGAYNLATSTNTQRPKYGALNLMLHPDGPSPRFGSCYFLLAPTVSRRCTYTYLDSHRNPAEKGTFAEFDDIVAALLQEVFERDSALGQSLTPTRLINHLRANLEMEFSDPSDKQPVRNLNHYIEAQVHGDVSLKEDVDVLVSDPSFKNTPIGEIFERICAKYNIRLFWHSGFALSIAQVPSDFRGNKMPSLARRIAKKDYIDVSIIGSAAAELNRKPDIWKDRGNYEEVLQELKLLWHVLVKYGEPLQTFKSF
jgi:hypothetical protein